MKVVKKDGTLQEYDEQKIIDAINKSASRALFTFTEEDYGIVCNAVAEILDEEGYDDDEPVPVSFLHSAVERVLLDKYPSVGQCYQQYRNYKLDFIRMMDEVYSKSQDIRYIGDVSNANSDATMVSTQRSLIYGELNKQLYKKFFLNKEELQAINDGYIYIHDLKDRLDSVNCCLFDMGNVLKGGFEMGNLWYNEPKSLDVAFDVISDVTMSAASQQYGGFTIPRCETILAKYAEMSHNKYYQEFLENADDIYNDVPLGGSHEWDKKELERLAEKYADRKVYRDFEQGFQSWEMAFNSVGSSRGDYPFIAISFGIGTSKFERMASEVALRVRMNGQGKPGYKRPVLFPKLTFLYDENLHGEGKELEYLFDIAIDCSSKSMYPDFLSLTGDGYIPSIYKKYGKVVSLMGKLYCSSIKNLVNLLQKGVYAA